MTLNSYWSGGRREQSWQAWSHSSAQVRMSEKVVIVITCVMCLRASGPGHSGVVKMLLDHKKLIVDSPDRWISGQGDIELSKGSDLLCLNLLSPWMLNDKYDAGMATLLCTPRVRRRGGRWRGCWSVTAPTWSSSTGRRSHPCSYAAHSLPGVWKVKIKEKEIIVVHKILLEFCLKVIYFKMSLTRKFFSSQLAQCSVSQSESRFMSQLSWGNQTYIWASTVTFLDSKGRQSLNMYWYISITFHVTNWAELADQTRLWTSTGKYWWFWYQSSYWKVNTSRRCSVNFKHKIKLLSPFIQKEMGLASLSNYYYCRDYPEGTFPSLRRQLGEYQACIASLRRSSSLTFYWSWGSHLNFKNKVSISAGSDVWASTNDKLCLHS